MTNLQEKVLQVLQNNGKIDGVLETISQAQENLLKNHSNPVFNQADKNKILKKYIELQNLGQSLYRYGTLKENNYLADAKEERDNIQNAVLKGGVSYNRYIWHSEKGDNTCDKCKDLDGQVFDFYDEVPERPHPNCKCTVEIVNEGINPQSSQNREEPCDCLLSLPQEFSVLIEKAQNIQTLLKEMIAYIIEQLKTNAGQFYENECQKIIEEASKWDNAAGDFARNYNDMLDANTIGADKYFHSKANCQATQRGGAGIVIAEAISLLREIEEGTRIVIFEGADLMKQIEDAKQDMDANKYGREQGRKYPDEDCEVLIDIFRPNGLPKKY